MADTVGRPRRPRKGERARWVCYSCGEILESWAAAERHADSHGGARLECLQDVQARGHDAVARYEDYLRRRGELA